jgi:hypothetical protein
MVCRGMSAGRVSFSGDGVAGLEKIVGGYYRGCPAPGESETGSTFTARSRWRTPTLCSRDWLAIASEQPSHMPVVLLYM